MCAIQILSIYVGEKPVHEGIRKEEKKKRPRGERESPSGVT